MELTLDSRMKLRGLTIHEKRKNYIVEESESGDFYEMPAICIDAIQLLQVDAPLAEIEEQLKNKYPSEDVDVLEFANQLIELGLVDEVDGQPIAGDKEKGEKAGRLLVSPATGRFFFNRLSLIVYAVLLGAIVTVFAVRPDLFPHYRDFFITDWMLVNSGVWLVMSLLVVLFHELGHFLAVRAEGLSSRLGIGHRLFLVVFETDMNGVWRLPANRRYVPYLGGICFDIVLLFTALMIRMLAGDTLVWLSGVAGMVVFYIFITLIYQCLFFMKTDLYYVIENALGTYNLMENSRSLLSRQLSRAGLGNLPGFKAKESIVYEGEEKLVKGYAVFYLAGLAVSLALFLVYFFPQFVYAFSISVPKLTEPVTTVAYWDGLFFMIEAALMIGLLVYSWIRKYTPARLPRDN
ncbi:hypothetical protein [Paenibacillus sp. J2TS4]|uniref:hypothetical protein n=1 Tax=Paenibacillus sp. J2TS4 TaxID=2807194 RepID=UPI001B27C835|nr:hypothetical protein [Paenibacillus sp. J2TS4]GIP34115.1 hypothetical protein J2TS4_33250 [Paenibacillus sp. J2TS4]